MNTRQFDIAILGNSISARISATIMAKNGQKVIHFRSPCPLEADWNFSSVFLEKLLGVLGGRSCFKSPVPFQVLSDHSRIIVHNETPIDEELSREFGAAASSAQALLEQLLESGTRLNLLLWENGGLPWPGLGSQVQFRWHCLRRKLSMAELARPLLDRLTPLDAAVQEFLKNLFQGLSLQPLDRLTFADGALLWAQANLPENISEPDFSTLLDKRFAQFHGVSEPLESLTKLEFKGSDFTTGHIAERGEIRAEYLLIGDMKSAADLLPTRLRQAIRPADVVRYTTSDLSGQLSPFLAEQVIAGVPEPLRLSLQQSGAETIGKVTSWGTPEKTVLKNRLATTLPFARYTLEAEFSPNDRPTRQAAAPQPGSTLFAPPLQLGRNVYCADSSALFPGMPAAGGALLGWTLLNRLCTRTKEGK